MIEMSRGEQMDFRPGGIHGLKLFPQDLASLTFYPSSQFSSSSYTCSQIFATWCLQEFLSVKRMSLHLTLSIIV